MGMRASCADYIANSVDSPVLQLNPRTELSPGEITKVFGYNRNLKEKYCLGKTIGAGSFGVVRECVEIATGRRYAVKTIGKVPKRGMSTPRYLLKLRTEVEIMQQLGTSFDAVTLQDMFEDDDNVHLVMQLCEGGALFERIDRARYTEKYILFIVRGVLRFISQCHAKGFIYRDVKPDNFLFLSKDPESPLKATDFGLSIRHWPDEPKLTSRSGTPAYMAPELVMQSYDEKCDIWSVGMLTYQLLTGRFPFWEDVRKETLTDVWRAVLTQNINWNAPELKQLSASAVDLLKKLLERDPTRRPSAKEALEHPWIINAQGAQDLPLQGSVVQRLQRFSTYGALKQMILKMIVEEMEASTDEGRASDGETELPHPSKLCTEEDTCPTSEATFDALKELFTQLDTDKSGQISLEELSVGLRSQGYVLSNYDIEILMRKIDIDHDGNVNLSEFLATLIDWNQMQNNSSSRFKDYVDYVFGKLDLDGDGFVSLDELVAHLPAAASTSGGKIDAEARLAEARQLIREADINGDGQISRKEMMKLMEPDGQMDSLSFYDDRLGAHLLRAVDMPKPQ
ncbi:hypothetical protein FOA52_009056 [Chlamydomonas sp. UWO 241]|nr:hypothetical protein FOA52_009056 [Chlamydomonas sp. UWO 241]